MMRVDGESIAVIAAALGVAKSSVSEWVRDIVLTQEQTDALRERQRSSSGRQKGSEENRLRGLSRRAGYQSEGRQRARQNEFASLRSRNMGRLSALCG
jgi:hypothetical protein